MKIQIGCGGNDEMGQVERTENKIEVKYEGLFLCDECHNGKIFSIIQWHWH